MPDRYNQVPASQSNLAGRKVLIVLPSLEMGGSERQALHLARHMKEGVGADVHVWSLGPPEGLAADQCRELGIPLRGVSFNWPCRVSTLLKRALRFAGLVRRARPDVLLPYCTAPNVVSGLVWRFAGAKTCIWNQRTNRYPPGRRLEKLALSLTPAAISNSASAKEYLVQALKGTPERIRVIHNGISLHAARDDVETWRKRLGADDTTLLACMVANFRADKDHECLLKAWRLVVDTLTQKGGKAILVLAGSRQQTHRSVKRMIGELHLDAHVRELGRVDDVTGLLQAVHLGILSTFIEGLPNALLEYMASGLPAIGSDIPGVREALGSTDPVCFFPVSDAGALASRILAFFGDAELREKLGRGNRERVEQEFALPKMLSRMVDVIEGQLQSAALR